MPKRPELGRTAYRGRYGRGLETPRAGRRRTADLRPLPPGFPRCREAFGGPRVLRDPASRAALQRPPGMRKARRAEDALARTISHVWRSPHERSDCGTKTQTW